MAIDGDAAPGATLCALGLMSGTSMDGVDAAILWTDGQKIDRTGTARTYPYSSELRELLEKGLDDAARNPDPANPSDEMRHLEDMVTDFHGTVVADLLRRSGMQTSDIDVIGFHGHTVYHRPRRGLTWQIGDGGKLAAQSGIDVVNDFRSNDVAAGGEGAPLAPLYHAARMSDRPAHNVVAVVNLGGVANVTWMDFSGGEPSILAFDCGPANALMDIWAETHLGVPIDEDGKLAGQGVVHSDILDALLDSPYFDESPPKSLDRRDFTVQAVRGLSPADGAATLTAFSAEAIVAAQVHFPKPVEAWYACGGGVHNRTLMLAIRQRTSVLADPVDALGWRGDFLEAEAFAYLAVRSLKGLPLSLPTTTGVSAPVNGGTLHKV